MHVIRKQVAVPVWKLAVAIPYPPANIHKIESGRHEPRLRLAVRIIKALDIDVGLFFQELACELGNYAFENNNVSEEIFVDDSLESFGELVRNARERSSLTQKAVAEYAGISQRCLINIEHGRTDPLVMNALAISSAIGTNIKVLFNIYSSILTKQNQA